MRLGSFLGFLIRDNRARKENRRNLVGDVGLHLRNRLLQPIDAVLARRHASPDHRILFIVGAPRSGTTLLYQLCARFLRVAYVDNLAARYWLAPVWGVGRSMRLRRSPECPDIPLNSNLGASEGRFGPHEFSYFWRHWFGYRSVDELDADELTTIDWSVIERKLGAIAGLGDAPVVVKNINFTDYHVAWIAERIPRAVFVCIDRDPVFVVQSILESRRKRYGDEAVWWSIRPADVEPWLDRPPLEQVCHQVRHVRSALARAFADLPGGRGLALSYDELVQSPATVLRRVADLADTPVLHTEALANLRLEPSREWRRSSGDRETVAELLAEGP